MSVKETVGSTVAIALPTASAWLYFVTFADAASMPFVYAACKVAQFSFPIAWFLLVSRHRGPAGAGSRGIALGLCSGLVAVALMWIVYGTLMGGTDLALEASPRIADRIVAIGAASPARFLGLVLLISVVHSFLEEYYWRWFVHGRLRSHLGAAGAGLLSSLAFTSHHVIVLHAFMGSRFWWMTGLLSLAVVIGGGFWAWLYERTGSLLSPWVSHTVVDLGIFSIGYSLSWRLL